MKSYLKNAIEKISLEYNDDFIEKLMIYLKLIMEYNSHTNITAIRDEKGIIEKHFIDSLLLSSLINSNDKSAIDIGTGAGFPGMVLALYKKNIDFTLIDSVKKKTNFLKIVKDELDVKNVEIINERSEDFIKKNKREYYDLAFCRGVSDLSVILEYAMPFLKVGGRFLPQKMVGSNEILNAENALKILKSKIINEYKFELPYNREERLVIEIEKLSKTDSIYPRKAGSALKKSL